MKLQAPNQLLKSPAGNHWSRIGIKHHHGFCIPLFSLHSDLSCGIGEFPDLIPVIRWCREVGYDIIQLLPLNDTGIETSPYSALSAFALNPMHLGLAHLPNIDNHDELMTLLKTLKQCTKTMRVDYPDLMVRRQNFLKCYFNLEGRKTLDSPAFRQFVAEHHWLKGYAVFKTLKEIGNWSEVKKWPKELQKPTEEKINSLFDEHKEENLFQCFVQFHCFKQMHQVKQVAKEVNVHLLGDLPILLGRESSDVWQYHTLFQPQYNAGVPPDMFSKDGQNWELPIYNWDNMRQEDYSWWKMRLDVASLFYDVYRIDHVLGLYRIWAIPYHLRGRKGLYIPEDPNDWVPQGEEILQMMLDSTSMFPVGEDLGFIPEDIYSSLRKMGIAGWKIVMWERDWDHDSSYTPFDRYPPANVVGLSTHDTLPLAAWWKQNAEDAKEFAAFIGITYEKILSPEMRLKVIKKAHTCNSLFHIDMMQEYLSLVPQFAFSNPEDERVNIPNTVNKYNWSIRFQPTVEEFTANELLKERLREILA